MWDTTIEMQHHRTKTVCEVLSVSSFYSFRQVSSLRLGGNFRVSERTYVVGRQCVESVIPIYSGMKIFARMCDTKTTTTDWHNQLGRSVTAGTSISSRMGQHQERRLKKLLRLDIGSTSAFDVPINGRSDRD